MARLAHCSPQPPSPLQATTRTAITSSPRGAVTLELRCPKSINGVSVDPVPDWTFDSLLSELNSIEEKLNVALNAPTPFIKSQSRGISTQNAEEKRPRAFIMRVEDDELEEEEEEAVAHNQSLVASRRFTFNELYMSDSDDSEEDSRKQTNLMHKTGLVEGALSELNHKHQLSVMEDIRNHLLAFERDLLNENDKFTLALDRVKKDTEARREMDRKLDVQYQRKIAEALDNHLTAIQRDHEHKSQIEERRIRDAAALEEAKRREKDIYEEKLRQEKIRAEAEMKAREEAEKKRAEEAKKALEASRRASTEAVEKAAPEPPRKPATPTLAPKETKQSVASGPDGSKKQAAGNIIKAAESALKEEERRLQIYKELVTQNEALGVASNKDYQSHGNQIARRIKTISGTKENVRSKAEELIKIFFGSSFPQSISIQLFAEKVVSRCANPTGSFSTTVFAYAQVVVLVTSKVPLAMDILIAELNRVCIFTVPKYMNFSESAFESKEAYYKAIGYQEDDGKIESTDSYIERLSSYMKLYGAIVQTDVTGVENLHGLKEGWAWIARFLNALPANIYTAVALQSFLEMAGFALYRKYKSQFKKILNVIARYFLNALKERGDPSLNKVIMNIQTYLESNQHLKEPDGWRLQSSLLSHTFVPESEQQQNYYYSSSRSYY